jgi:hypothetical protein
MKKLNDNHLDKLFRDGLTDPEAPVNYREADWKDMAKLLDGESGKKAGFLRMGYFLSGIAALFLLAFGLFFLINNEHSDILRHKSSQGNVVIKRGSNHDVIKFGSTLKPLAKPGKDLLYLKEGIPQQVLSVPGYAVIPAPHYPALKSFTDTLRSDLPLIPADHINVLATTALPDSVVQMHALQQAPDSVGIETQVSQTPERNKNKADKGVPAFALTLLGAPDLNTVNSLNGAQMGGNVSLQLSVKLTQKLSITTGAAYAIKPYQSSFAQYNMNYSPAVQPSNVAANCQVLDIPLNINYQLYAKGSNSLMLGTGLSSYFMLKEKYRFDYTESSGISAYSLVYAGKNQHVFGVLNLNATYQRKINSKFSAVVQPYFKVPLTGIGNGQVSLKSTGIAVGLNWNINLLKKPK